MHIRLAHYGAFTEGTIWIHFARYTRHAKLTPAQFALHLETLGMIKKVVRPGRKEVLWKPIKPFSNRFSS